MESEGNAGVQIQVLQTFGWWKNFKRFLFQWEKYFLYVSDFFFFFVASIETDLCVATGVNDILNNTGKKVRKKTKSNNKNYFHYSLSLLVLFAKWYFLLDFLIMRWFRRTANLTKAWKLELPIHMQNIYFFLLDLFCDYYC